MKAAKRADGQGVLRCAEKALALGVPEQVRFELYMAENEALQFLGQREAQLSKLHAAVQTARNDAERARALTELVKWNTVRDPSVAVGTGARAVEAARACGSVEVLVLALGRQGLALIALGRLDEAQRSLREAESMAEQCPVHVQALLAGWLGHAATARGKLGDRLHYFVENANVHCALPVSG